MTVKKLIEIWAGPVCMDARYWADTDEAVEWIIDDAHPITDPLLMPEYLECCDEIGPRLDAESVIESMDDYDCNVRNDDEWASVAVTTEHKAKLQAFLDQWCAEIDWRAWWGNGRFVRIREDIIKSLAAQRENR
jgi:hypothetical protein